MRNGLKYLVLSALGPDRPGLVASISEYIATRKGNVDESRMVILGAEFGVLVLVSGDESAVEAIARELPELERATGMSVLARPTKAPGEHRANAAIPAVVTAEALDDEGIVHAIATSLTRHAVNIVSVETSAYNAPVTGAVLFRMEAQVDVPRGLTLTQLRASLEEVGRTEGVDIEVRSVTVA